MSLKGQSYQQRRNWKLLLCSLAVGLAISAGLAAYLYYLSKRLGP